MIEYGPYIITRAPLHVPFEWEWSHRNYDGAPEHIGEGPADHRHGYGNTIAECRELIDEIEDAAD